MDKKEGLELLKGVIDKEIVHEDYDRVTKLADKYYKLKTGDGIEDLLQQIESRVSEEEFEQIKKIYRSIIPATLNSTKMPFLKATRKQPIETIDFETESEQRVTELKGFIDSYWGDKSLEKYLEYAFVDYNYLDPNAFLITEFGDFDPNIEKAKPYPFVASSEEAIIFEYQNEILQYLIVKLPIIYMDGDTEKDGYKYTLYLGMDTVVLSQVATSTALPEGAEGVIEIKSKYYAVYYYDPKNDKVPAIRFGYLRDEQTKGRTFVSVFHCVVGLLEKTLKIDSELDLSCAMVAFPQRFAYVSACKNEGCNKGFLLDGKECPVCHGTGTEPFHKGTQDVITLTLPKDPTQMIDLNKLLVYKGPPIELLEFDSEYLEKLEKKVHAKMFNADLYTRDEVSTTATEQLLEADNLNDTLYGFAQHYSSIWIFVVKDIATITDLEGVILTHQFPKDFKFKNLTELMGELKVAKDASASSATIAAIEDDINELLYADRPDDLKRINVKNDFNPFRGYSETNIRFIISQGNTTQYNRTLWENQESIFQELERENQDPWLYDLAPEKLAELIEEKTNDYISRINEQKQAEQEQFAAQQDKRSGFNAT